MVVEYYFTQDSVLLGFISSFLPLPQTARAALRHPRCPLLRNDNALLIDYLVPTLQVPQGTCHGHRQCMAVTPGGSTVQQEIPRRLRPPTSQYLEIVKARTTGRRPSLDGARHAPRPFKPRNEENLGNT